MHGTATTSRFYLQVNPGTRDEQWGDEAIWAALARRLAADGQVVIRGPIVDRSLLELHSYVTQPMQVGPLHLAGDAAHIVTPAGGKGMNLALQDMAELVEGLIGFYHGGDTGRLDRYSATRLPQVWRAVECSHSMLEMLLARRTGMAEGHFHEGLRQARLARLMEGGAWAQDFAVTYVGIDK